MLSSSINGGRKALKQQTMNAWHVYARYYNFGDHGLGIGVRNLFQRYFDRDLLFKLFDTHDLEFDRRLIRKMNSEADLLLVGGGGLIHELRGRWMFRMPDSLVREARAPIVVYGIGYNQFRGQPAVSGRVLKNIRSLQEKALAFSVRNDGSREILSELGIAAEEVPVPGFFAGPIIPSPPLKGDYAVLQLAADMKRQRGYRDDEFVPEMRGVMRYILGQGCRIVLAPHVKADMELCRNVMSGMETDGAILWDLMRLLRDEHNLEGLSYYRHARFVIGMRGHAQVFSIAAGVPVITIGNHRKHLDLLRKLRLPEDYYTEATDPDLGARLIGMIERLETERDSLCKLYRSRVSEMEDAAGQFITRAANRMGQGNA